MAVGPGATVMVVLWAAAKTTKKTKMARTEVDARMNIVCEEGAL